MTALRLSTILTPGALALALGLAACGPATNTNPGGVDAPIGSACSGSETRCLGAEFQTCQGGAFSTTQTCTSACDPVSGCRDCDPAAGNACSGNNVVTCNADGSFGSTVQACTAGTTCGAGTCMRSCSADGVDLIFLVDDANNFVSFDPRMINAAGGPYHLIAPLTCPNPGTPIDGATGAATPFSMAVDRGEHDPVNNYPMAWVLYNSGKIFKVSTHDGSCTATNFAVKQSTPPQTWNLFGMGYVTDAAGAEAEKLWVGGGNLDGMTAGSVGYLDDALKAHYVAPMGPSAEYSAELTGLGDATLWAFFPDTVNNAFVQQIDKATGAGVGAKFMFDLAASGRAVQAWAFAQWGGSFYVFVTTVDALTGTNPNATVHVIDRTTGAHTVPLQNQQYVVVGAGVSTCAPVVIGHTL
jgi:hypothetical protein